ncbi:MAG: portal protein [Akkermansia sp.]
MDFKQLKRACDALLAQRDQYKSDWCRIARKVHPTGWAEILKAQGGESTPKPNYCETAAMCCQTLATAHSMGITPSTALWFLISSPLTGGGKRSDDAFKYSLKLSKALWRAWGLGNFTQAFAKMWMDRCGIGHGATHVRVNQADGRLVFTHIPAGSFAFAKDESGRCNTIVREFDLSPCEAVKRYGRENLGKKLMKDYEDVGKRYTEMHRFLHVILPNEDGQPGSFDRAPKQRLFTEYIIHPEDEKIVQENGLYEFPFMVTRFLEYGSNPYGISPAQLAEKSIDRAEDMDKVMDILGHQAVEPPMLTPVPMVGMVDYRPAATTPVPDDYLGGNYPRPLAPQGRYDIGQERIREAKEMIKLVFYYDVVLPLTGIDKVMTAEEVRRLVNEKTSNFVHSFSQAIDDLTPFLEASLAMLYRWALKHDKLGDDGVLPKVPSELQDDILLQAEDGEDVYFNRFNVTFTSKMAVAIQDATNQGDLQGLQQAAAMVEMTGNAELLDYLKMDNILKDVWLWLSANPDNLRSDKEVQAIRDKRAEAQQEQQAMQAAMAAGQVARDFGSVQQKEAQQ